MSPEGSERKRRTSTNVGARDEDLATEQVSGRPSSQARGGPHLPDQGPSGETAAEGAAERVDEGTDGEIAAPNAPTPATGTDVWHRLSTRHDEDVQTGERVSRPRDKEAVEGANEVVSGFTNTSQTGTMGGRAVYGMDGEEEEEEGRSD